jgi:conjugative transfer signal peptidase TraF
VADPILAWQPRRRPGRWRGRAAVVAAAGLAALAVAVQRQDRALVVYNASASAPLGFYRVLAAEPLHRGDLVLARTPPSVRRMAASRGYLPKDVFLVKRIAALGGDPVCAHDHRLSVRGDVVRVLATDRLDRPLTAWSGCRALTGAEVLLLMADKPASFDGRYFGPTPRSDVIGRLERIAGP